jgi:hypothetical protein
MLLFGLIPILAPSSQAGHLHTAAYGGDVGLTEVLLARGADVNAEDSSGVAPLHYAAVMGHTDVIEILLAGGAFVDMGSKTEGNTPLHLASGSGHYEAAALLLGHGASLDKRNSSMETPLHWAVENGRAEVVVQLAGSGADTGAKDAHGMTPLHHAAVRGYADIVSLLLDEGASPRTRDLKGVSPMTSALEQGYIRIARILRLAGAPIENARDLARFIQGQLRLRGYGIRETDGIWGPRSASALKTYQRHAGLSEEGIPTHEVADNLASTGEIAPYLSGDRRTVTNIFVSWYEFAEEHGWEPGLLWSRAELANGGLSETDHDFRDATKYSGRVRFGGLEIAGTVWVVPDGWVIAHGSRVILRPVSEATRHGHD